MTAVICSPLPVHEAGHIMLRLDWAGAGIDGEVVVLRRTAGATDTDTVIGPASAAGPNGGWLTSGGTVVFADTTAPLDVAVEYLSAPYGDTSFTVSDSVTLESLGYWWIGDPLVPASNIRLSVSRTTAAGPCSSDTGVFIVTFGGQTRSSRSVLTESDATGDRRHTSVPRLSNESSMTFATRQLSDLAAVNTLLDPGNTLCLRAPGATTYGFDTSYLDVGESTVSRLTMDMRKTWRMVDLPTVEVLAPSGAAAAALGASWDEVCAGAWPTFADLTTDDITYSDTSMGIAGGVWPTTYPTCDDVAATYATCALLAAAGLTCLELATGV